MAKQDLLSEEFYFNRERYKHEGALGIFMLMERAGVSRTELSEMLGKPKSLISKMLKGYHNFTFETFADICKVLGRAPHIVFNDAFEARAPLDEATQYVPPTLKLTRRDDSVSLSASAVTSTTGTHDTTGTHG